MKASLFLSALQTLKQLAIGKRRNRKKLKEGFSAAYAFNSKIEKLFKEKKPYLNPNITITDLVRILKTNRSNLSAAINQGYSMNFSQLRNCYRISHFCKHFISDKKADITALYKESGFTAYSAFYTAFSLHVGTTPVKWCQEVRGKQAKNIPVKAEDYILEPTIRKSDAK